MGSDLDEPRSRRGRGRPRSTDAVDPADILDAAIDAISHGGYDALSMRGVARSLDISLPTVQHHFGTKADLYRAVVDHVLADVDQLRSLVPERDLHQRIRNGIDASHARPGLLSALLADRAAGHEERLAYFAHRFSQLLGEPATTVAELQSGQPGRPVDPVAFMVLLLGVATMASIPEALRAVYGIDLTNADERSHLAAGLADLLGHGLFDAPTTPTEEQ